MLMKAIAPQIQSQANESAGLPSSAALDCQAAFQSIAKSCVNLIRDHRKAAIAAEPEAIDSMRIELTRLRAAVLFFSPMTEDGAWPGISKDLRWLNLAPGKARDHDVTANYTLRRRYRSVGEKLGGDASRSAQGRSQIEQEARLGSIRSLDSDRQSLDRGWPLAADRSINPI
jgi:CHAD domain-containing protein